MAGLLEVIALDVADARAAADGGADRIELVGTMECGGLSPEPALVERVCAAVEIPVRPMLRLRDGYSTDGGELTRLRGLASSYVSAGAEGVVFGFLDRDCVLDLEVMSVLLADGGWPWTLHRAIDQVLDLDRAWEVIPGLPRLDQVLTAGSANGVDHGMDELVRRARELPVAAALIMAGGGLKPDHVPWLARADISAFHVGGRVRADGTFGTPVDAGAVSVWRRLVDGEVR